MILTVTDDNSEPSPRRRIRRTPDAARELALDAAHRLLVQGGPAAVTLKAVAAATGMRHGNLNHHFGSVATLHSALFSRMAQRLSTRASEAVARLRRGESSAEDVVDLVFSTFVETGCGRLIGWLAAAGEQDALEPIFASLRGSVEAYRAGEPAGLPNAERGAGPIALELICHALTASLVGERLEAATHMPPGSLRRLAIAQLIALRAT
ncbi:TetR/AcrR family transcriptional regulator [Acetobacteraceae bacterium KSS8]|uniref:TetR/AcrR family transcriptional regulator n=1 Tax=Endosaccharibacter trunci TaxID=2812733 RepID=A0ABT1W885_9PROT|nr:TetR/AcrR family transcriptional regulator [Acetobacteraceae bacterium KSS8]